MKILFSDLKGKNINFDKVFSSSSDELKQYYINSKNKKSALTRLAAHILLNELFRLENINNPIIVKNEYGKPYIENLNVYFSLSHTDDFVCCCVDNNECGIDCERESKKDFLKLSEKFFSKNEHIIIQNTDSKSDVFFDIWTKKESYVKYLGTGFNVSPSTFDITTANDVNFKAVKLKDVYLTVCSKKEISAEISSFENYFI